MSTLKTTNITHGDNAGTNNLILDDTGKVSIAEKKLYSPGCIIQVKQTVKTDTWTSDNGSSAWEDITGMNVSITPTYTTSEVLVSWNLNFGVDNGHIGWKLVRGSTDINIGDAAGSRIRASGWWHRGHTDDKNDIINFSGEFLDTGIATTSATTYKIQMATPYSDSYQAFLNRPGDDTDVAWVGRTASSITVKEICRAS